MKQGMAAVARLQALIKTYEVVPASFTAVQVAWVQVVAQYGSEIKWDPKEVNGRNDLNFLLNQQSRSVLGALLITPRGALMRE